MKSFKKLLALLLTLSLVCAICACSKTTTEEPEEEPKQELSADAKDLIKTIEEIWEDEVCTEKEMDTIISLAYPEGLDEHNKNKELYGLFDEAGNQTMNWCQLIEQGYVDSYMYKDGMIYNVEQENYSDFVEDIWEYDYGPTKKTKELAGVLKMPEEASVFPTNNKDFLKGCKNLTGFSAPNLPVDKIEKGFFEGCENLGVCEFGNATGYDEIRLDDFTGWKWFEETKKEGPVAIANAFITWGDKEADTVLFPMGIEYWSWELNETNRAKKVVFPSGSVTAIENDFLEENDYVEEVVIEEGCLEIGKNAFYGCSGLDKITIPESVTYIHGTALSAGFMEEQYRQGKENVIINGILVDSKAFGEDNTDKKLVIGEDITHIAQYAFVAGAFDGWTNVEKEVFIGKHITVIPEYAFTTSIVSESPQIDLSTVHFEGKVETIEQYAFRDCNIENITFPDGLKTIGTGAFERNNFAKIVLPDSVERVDYAAFKDCKNLKEITIPANCDVSSSAFEGCDSLTKINYEGDSRNYPFGAPNVN